MSQVGLDEYLKSLAWALQPMHDDSKERLGHVMQAALKPLLQPRGKEGADR